MTSGYWELCIIFYIFILCLSHDLYLIVWWLLGIFTYASSSSWRLIGNCEECLSSTPSVEACTYWSYRSLCRHTQYLTLVWYLILYYYDSLVIQIYILLLNFWTFEHSPQSTILTQPHVNTVLESPHTNIGFES